MGAHGGCRSCSACRRRALLRSCAALSSRRRYRLVGLPPGNWRLALGHESELELGRELRTFDVTIVAGEATKLDLELR